MKIKSKVWIDVEGEPVFGRGRMQLLKAIERFGSINQAAKEINISYRKAWSYIKIMEDRLGIDLVQRQAGGINGGGAMLTKDARDFISKYEIIEGKIVQYADEVFKQVFDLRG
ncbi:MAG: winged helix-turn-helix domain-containing protein [Thermodesulfovibrionales bacterium]|nr:winged helix-turn-helix domain-containing protein [Thermodesulfovibrionales bacterium]